MASFRRNLFCPRQRVFQGGLCGYPVATARPGLDSVSPCYTPTSVVLSDSALADVIFAGCVSLLTILITLEMSLIFYDRPRETHWMQILVAALVVDIISMYIPAFHPATRYWGIGRSIGESGAVYGRDRGDGVCLKFSNYSFCTSLWGMSTPLGF